MKKLKEYSIIYSFGAILYSLIEVMFRGFTHWTMTITGGFAFLSLYVVNFKMKSKKLISKCFIGSLIITILEFIVGCIVNRKFNLGVWDYSHQKMNILGQICPLFSAVWFLLCIPGIMLCCLMKKHVGDKNH